MLKASIEGVSLVGSSNLLVPEPGDEKSDIDRPTEEEIDVVDQPGNSAEFVEHSFREMEMASGPLPPPSMLKAYEEVLPGSAERLLANAEKIWLAGIRDQEKKTVYAGRNTLHAVYAFAAVAVIGFLAAAVIAATTGESAFAWPVGIGAPVASVAIFLIRRFFGRSNESDKSNERSTSPEGS